MIPSALASQLQQGMADYLRASFWSGTPGFDTLIERLIQSPQTLFQGPYLSLKLPFQKGEGASDFFPEVPLEFQPHRHQEQAFRRLAPPHFQSTLVATGTGSGKTESFLIPILAHCARQQHTPGIKAIIIYPMNALATDQARRIATLIDRTPSLRGTVRAGMYIGQTEKNAATHMEPSRLITDRKVLRTHPPDILLTNYRMLDFLLMRPADQPLWSANDAAPTTLRYLVVDELHTFDGAQGTDLACLLRRLSARLHTPPNHLCCVGTSATLGTEGRARHDLLAYAQQIFNLPFDDDAIITESRLSPEELMAAAPPMYDHIPPESQSEELAPEHHRDLNHYLSHQANLWFPDRFRSARWQDPVWRCELSHVLLGHTLFRSLVHRLDGKVRSMRWLEDELARLDQRLADCDPTHRQRLLISLLSLVSEARRNAGRAADGTMRTTPFLNVQVQLWMRELRRMVASVGPKPKLRFDADLTQDQRRVHLPVIQCKECGAMGWAAAYRKPTDSQPMADLDTFYRLYFRKDPKTTWFFPWSGGRPPGHPHRMCGGCLTRTLDARATTCTLCGEPTFPVFFADNRRVRKAGQGTKEETHTDCPLCASTSALLLVGFQGATLIANFIEQLYASRYNDDKKLLTFSDSVQDAAHRAGFFATRTWRFNLRLAIQQAVMAHADETKRPLPLSALPEQVIAHWRHQYGDSDEDFVATFVPPNLMWMQEVIALMTQDRLPEKRGDLLNHIRQRIRWEVFAEYGQQARIGRSLSRVGASVASVPRDRLLEAAEKLLEPLQNEGGQLRDLSQEVLVAFLNGMLRRLQERGGIFHDQVPEDYIETGGKKTWAFLRRPWLPAVGRTTRLPTYLTLHRGTGRFDCLAAGGRKLGWYDAWAFRVCFTHQAMLSQDLPHQLYPLTLKILTKAGILECRPITGGQAWGLAQDILQVHTETSAMACLECRHDLTIPSSMRDLWSGTPCLAPNCTGLYEVAQTDRHRFHRQLMATGEVHRVFAEEHTGLLERDTREQVETLFKSQTPRRWHPNLLSCTPTLEMGIDIGDLSSAILCSVPPAQANYLQRIGRAGRRDGNALLLTMAKAAPHDLYFFAKPTEMIAGEVTPPGVFLNASAVLKRQLLAYCVDCWVAAGASPSDLPTTMQHVINNLAHAGDITRFPANLLAYMDQNRADLCRGFLALFQGQLSADTEARLRTLLMPGSQDGDLLRWQISSALHTAKDERQRLKNKLRTVEKQRKALANQKVRDDADDERLANLEGEKHAVNALIRAIDTQQTLNFFTDEGLLPNYAFPESGVTLKSVILRRKGTSISPLSTPSAEAGPAEAGPTEAGHAEAGPAEAGHAEAGPAEAGHAGSTAASQTGGPAVTSGGGSRAGAAQAGTAPATGSAASGKSAHKARDRYERIPTKYVRGAATAIVELAPSNTFYAGGHRVKIEQVDFSDHELETWRLCDNCDRAANVAKLGEEKVCASCGSERWADAGQKHTLLRLRRVYASALDRKSRIGDEHEERNPRFYQRQLLVSFQKEQLRDGWHLDTPELPFGFQYVQKCTFTEINFGEKNDYGTRSSVAGEDTVREGFTLCRRCGRVQSRFQLAQGKLEHAAYCRVRESHDPRHLINCLYLYRELESEAIRILLPTILEVDGEELIHSFIAALDLGLKRRFRGKVDHLRTTRTSEPKPDSSLRQQYLVLFDTVPGGTGYLKELAADPARMQAVLTLARDTLRSCPCGTDPAKDGCYRCLLAYRHSMEMKATSRQTALNLLNRILSHWQTLKATPTLSDISLNVLFDSALEERFIQALARRARHAGGHLSKQVVNGKPGYRLKLADQTWLVEPQVELGRSLGVTVASRADFLLRPVSQQAQRKPIAIFTDGFAYHADRIGDDLLKRMAIVRSGRFQVWSLTWPDVAWGLTDAQAPSPVDLLPMEGIPDTVRTHLFGALGLDETALTELAAHPFDGLMIALAASPTDETGIPRAERQKWLAALMVMAHLFSQPKKRLMARDAWLRQLGAVAPLPIQDALGQGIDPAIFRRLTAPPATSPWHLFLSTEQSALKGNLAALQVACWLDDRVETRARDDFQDTWRGVLHCFNRLQYLEEVFFISAHAQSQLDFTTLFSQRPSTERGSPALDAAAWEDAFEILEPSQRGGLAQLQAGGAPPPDEPMFELTDGSRINRGQAILAWSMHQVCLLTEEEAGYRQAFEAAGWHAFTLEEASSDPDRLLRALRG